MNKSPTHEQVAQRAQKIWQESGNPSGRDTEIWFEAERQLAEAGNDSNSGGPKREQAQTTSESRGASALAERVKDETAAESMVEHHISPPIPNDEAVKAALQKKEARAPQFPAKSAPKSKPPESGKPVWDKPHSS